MGPQRREDENNKTLILKIKVRNSQNYNEQKLIKLKNLLSEIESSQDSSFYRDIFESMGIEFKELRFDNTDNLQKIPHTSYLNLLSTSLNKRLYTKESHTGKFVKIVRKYGSPFLIQRNLNDIQKENYGVTCRRPQVFFDDNQEAIEKCVWFYENNMLPLVGELNNLPVTAFSAKKYGIDFLLTNQDLFLKYLPFLTSDNDVSDIKISLLDDYFEIESILEIFPTIKNIRLVLALPETGAFAESCPEALKRGELIFHPDKNSILETRGSLIVTKLIKMPTPIIRYQTDIFVESVDKRCRCEEEMCFSLI